MRKRGGKGIKNQYNGTDPKEGWLGVKLSYSNGIIYAEVRPKEKRIELQAYFDPPMAKYLLSRFGKRDKFLGITDFLYNLTLFSLEKNNSANMTAYFEHDTFLGWLEKIGNIDEKFAFASRIVSDKLKGGKS